VIDDREGGRPIDPDSIERQADRPLVLASGLRTRLDAAGHVRVDTPLGGIVDAGPDGHAILSLFARPRTVPEAVVMLTAVPSQETDVVLAETTIASLVEAGALVEDGGTGDRWGWTDPAEHARMLDDVRRTDAFTAAIRAAVRADDVVLDIGTGSGILAMTAALAGARHVYAIEASDIAGLARRAIADNGLADRITLLEGWSTQLRLPEPATLLVSEVIGAEPLEEDVLGTTIDARRRLLTPDARLIPHRLALQVQAVSVPQMMRWASRVDRASVERWQVRYGVDLSALWASRRREALPWTVDGMTAATWPSVGPRTTLVDLDLTTVQSPAVEAAVEIVIDGPGVVDAILVTWEAALTDDIALQGPPWLDLPSSWDSFVWFLPDALTVEAGSRLGVRYRYGVAGHNDGLECAHLAADEVGA
jgi:precorrin-6B methylase 2